MALLTLFIGEGFKLPQILTLYMLDWKGLVLGIPKMYHTGCSKKKGEKEKAITQLKNAI